MRTPLTAGRPAHRPARPLALVGAGAGAGLVLALLTGGPAAATTVEPEGTACEGDEGVTVVVDATDLDGPLTVACVTEQDLTGGEALAEAGHDAERDEFMMVCSIDGRPDPCPEEFTGLWWTYWTMTPDGEWTLHDEGPDTFFPAPGAVEGWRWSDDTAAPRVDLATLGTVTPAPADEDGVTEDAPGGPADEPADEEPDEEAPADPGDGATPGTDEAAEDGQDVAPVEADAADGQVPVLLVAALLLAALIGVGALVAASRRRRTADAPTAAETDEVGQGGSRTDAG